MPKNVALIEFSFCGPGDGLKETQIAREVVDSESFHLATGLPSIGQPMTHKPSRNLLLVLAAAIPDSQRNFTSAPPST